MISDLETPPTGYKPGQTRAPLIWNISVPLGVVAVILAGLRLYVRACLVRVVGKDDWLLLAAVVFLCGLVGSALWGTSLGIGKHQYDVNQEIDPHKIISTGVITMIFYNLCQCCVQCSILAFYLRLGLAEIGRKCNYMRNTIYALMGLSVVNNTISPCLLLVFTLVESLLVQSKYFTGLWFTYGTLNLLMDLIIWSIPLPTLFSIMSNLSTRKKVLLVLEFAVGMMSWCSSILRISFWRYAAGVGTDPTYNAPILYVLYVAEVSLAISCVSLAALRPLVVKVTKGFNRLRGKPTSTNKSRSTDYELGANPGPAQSRTGDSRTTGNKGGFTTADQELVEWKSGVLDIEIPQFVQQACSCPCNGDAEPEIVVAHTSSCPRCPDPAWGTQPQALAPAPAPDHGITHHPLSCSSGETLGTTNTGSECQSGLSQRSCDALPSSDSTVNLTNADTNSTNDYISSSDP